MFLDRSCGNVIMQMITCCLITYQVPFFGVFYQVSGLVSFSLFCRGIMPQNRTTLDGATRRGGKFARFKRKSNRSTGRKGYAGRKFYFWLFYNRFNIITRSAEVVAVRKDARMYGISRRCACHVHVNKHVTLCTMKERKGWGYDSLSAEFSSLFFDACMCLFCSCVIRIELFR